MNEHEQSTAHRNQGRDDEEQNPPDATISQGSSSPNPPEEENNSPTDGDEDMKRSLWGFGPSHRPMASWAEIGTICLTAAIVVIGVEQACIYSQQKEIMKSSGKQTQQLIDAANIQACAANKIAAASDRNAAAADRFAASADGINAQTKLAVDKFDRMAKSSEDSIRTIQKTAKDSLDASVQASRLDERPWVVGDSFVMSGEPSEGKMPVVKITVKNTGKTPALDMFPISQPSIWDHCAPFDESTTPPAKSIGVLAPGQAGTSFATDPLPYIKASVDEYNAGLNRYCIRAKILYVDVDKVKHWTTLCVFHTHGRDLNEFDYCSEGNAVDTNK